MFIFYYSPFLIGNLPCISGVHGPSSPQKPNNISVLTVSEFLHLPSKED